MSGTNKLLVLALDAASPDLLRRWAGDGTLPNTLRLMRDGLVTATRSVEGLYVGATWPSFYTARDPSWHGIYWLDRIRAGTYRIHRGRPDDFAECEALWEVISRAGKRVLVLDVPLTRLSPGLNGIQIVEWGVHDAAFGFRTNPASLKGEILRLTGPHPAPTSCDARRSLADYCTFAEQLARGAAARGQLTRHLLESQQWDFAIQVFSETHCAGHQLWHFHDESHPAFDIASRGDAGNLLKDVYKAVDRSIGNILESLKPGTTVVLLTLHGMSHTCGGSLLLPEILHRLGATNAASDDPVGGTGRGPGRQQSRKHAVLHATKRAYHRLPQAFRKRIYAIREHINQDWLRRGSPIDMDPGTSSAFYVGLGTGSTFSGIRLNLQGREPQGILPPGKAEDQFCASLAANLLELKRPGTATRVVRRVLHTREIYEGPLRHCLPDLLVEWNPEPPMGTSAAGDGAGSVWQVHSDAVGLLEKRNTYCRTGEHRIDGMLVACGPGIPVGRLAREISILDLAPTFARILGCDMPVNDRTPIAELLGG